MYVSTDLTVDAAFCLTFEAYIWTIEKSEPKIWMHIKHCLSNDKAIAIQEAQKLHCVDEAASDAENLCKWCQAILIDIFENFCSKIFGKTLQDVHNLQHRFYLVIRP